jgi:lipopolysaccharide/colanic/teichoic acid biosynthesis glycosyltransferase
VLDSVRGRADHRAATQVDDVDRCLAPAPTAQECPTPSVAEWSSRKPLDGRGSALGRVVAWLLVPVVLLTALLFLPFLLASSREFPVWRQRRVGHLGRDIWVLKFTTMKGDASGTLRETWFGRIIRPLGVDEILQILIIAKGDMQWFGPRPFLRKDLDDDYVSSVLPYTKPGFFNSRSLATGIGNRALQEGRINVAEMIRYDLEDLRRWGPSYALTLFVKTALMVSTTAAPFKRRRYGVSPDA